MAPFWSGLAIGLGITFTIASICLVLFVLAWVGEWLLAIVGGAVLAAKEGMAAERAKIDAKRAELAMEPFDRRKEFRANLRRTWRLFRHPIRERALLAEAFSADAIKNPATHKWEH
jgi:hypothetical protein